MSRPHDDCLTGGPLRLLLFLVLLPFIVTTKLLDTYKIDSCALVIIGGFAGWAILATGAWQVLT